MSKCFTPLHITLICPSITTGKAQVAVLFSGGIDSSVIAYLAHRCVSFYSLPMPLMYCRHIPLDQPIDLLNVAFENPRKIKIQEEGNMGGMSKRRTLKFKPDSSGSKSNYKLYEVPDRVTGKSEVEELQWLCPGRTWNFVRFGT